MITRRGLAGLALLGAAGAATAARAQTQSRRAEVDAFRQAAETTHPRGREAAADADWRARWAALAAEADQLTDGAYFIRTRRALGWFKDGHTTVLPFEFVGGVPDALARGPFARALPIGVRVFHDGAYITSAKNEATPLFGARITRIGEMDAAALVRAWAQDWPGNDAWAHRWAGGAFSSPAFLQALGAVRDPGAPVEVHVAIGRRRLRVALRPRADGGADLQQIQRTKHEREAWAEAARFSNYARRVGAALYIGCDEMDDLEGKDFAAFTAECFAALDDPGAEKVIVDLRRNGGGNNFLFEALRKRMARSRFNRPGGLYVLISPQTFSAAQNAVNRLERETFATFVGEPTGGAPNHYGDGTISAGAVTGITALISTLPWFDSYPQDHRVWTMPDVPTPALFADWRDGRDTALQAALAHRTDAETNEWSEASVFYFRRASQAVEWRPFWRNA